MVHLRSRPPRNIICWMEQALFLAAVLVGEVEFHGAFVLPGTPRAEKLHRLDTPPDPEVDFSVT